MVKKISLFSLIKESYNEFLKDKALTMSAALAFYVIISIAPLFVLMIMLLGIFFEQSTVLFALLETARQIGGQQAVDLITFIIRAAQSEQKTLTSIVSLALLVFGASAFFTHLESALNLIWNTSEKSSKTGKFMRVIKTRAKSFFVVLIIVIIFTAYIILNLVLSSLKRLTIFELSHNVSFLLFNIISNVVLLILMIIFFVLIYKNLPSKKLNYKDVIQGSVFTAVLFIIGQVLISIYLGYSSVGSVYGTAGSMLVFLMWAYYTSAIFFLGAEFTHLYATKYGSRLRKNKK